MPNIHHEVVISASSGDVYDAITSQHGLRAWWTPGAESKSEVNSIARFAFAGNYFKEMKIVELVPNALVKWECIAGAGEWVGTKLSFELHTGNKPYLLKDHPEAADQIRQNKTDSATLVIFHHNDWKGNTPMFAECNYTWGQFLRSLKIFCETGQGRPWPEQHKV